MSSIKSFIPPEGDNLSGCSNYCPPPTDKLCNSLCDPYTYGPFKAPATLYTYHNYSRPAQANCTPNTCEVPHIEYDIYQIIEDVEYFVGTWDIRDKVGPNKKEFKECGEYILKYCSSPAANCYPECLHPEVPEIHTSVPALSATITKICIIEKNNPDATTLHALLKTCASCGCIGDENVEVSLFDITGSTQLDINDYHVVECC